MDDSQWAGAMTAMDIAPWVLGALALIILAAAVVEHIKERHRLEAIERKLEEIATRLQSAPRYFCDTGSPSQAKRSLAAVRAANTKGFGASLKDGRLVHDPRPGVDEG